MKTPKDNRDRFAEFKDDFNDALERIYEAAPSQKARVVAKARKIVDEYVAEVGLV